ncbi:hypothetical protein ACLE20_13380 [Rhizobium sp. YIM 134829]|uniref:hypothetical protein n=1 Tax=Rhizobium sp. YIM 134829 TaxID=3390453 RepID=UPI00397C960F
MKYQAWTWKAVEDRVIEMADTIRMMPRTRGPKQFGSSMPEAVQSFSEAYGSEEARYRESASAAALGRSEQVWGWINTFLDEPSRKLLYAWSWVKVRKGMKISAFAAQNDMNDRMLRRSIQSHCQSIANSLNRITLPRLNNGDLPLSENEGEHGQSDVTSNFCERTPRQWMAPDAKPILDMDSPELATLIARIEKGNERREREARRRQKLGMEA